MKPLLAFLRQCGHIISGYIDDQYLQGKTQQKCIADVIAAITLFENFGLVIHPEKSVIVPQQRLVFLGFIIDSLLMTVNLTQDKITKIKTLLSSLLENSDASLQGWGAVMNKTSTGGMWLPTGSEHHINYLELLAAFFALQCFHSSLSGKHVKIMIDNTSAVFQINNVGTCQSEECNSLVVQIWEFCISHNIPWLTAAHIPGSSNVIADGESRHFHSQDTE